MKPYNLLNTLILLILFCSLNNCQITQSIESKIKSQKVYKSQHYQNTDLYSIDITRLSSTNQLQQPVCHSKHKQINIKHQTQIYRLKSSNNNNQTIKINSNDKDNREQSIFTKLTTLDDDTNIIQEFQIIGNDTFLVTTQGKGYFLDKSGKQFEVNLMLNLTSGRGTYKLQKNNSANSFFNIIILNFKQRALVISSNGISLCRNLQSSCILITNFQPIQYLFNAQLFIQDAITYLFLLTGSQIIVYQLTAGNQLKNKIVYDAKFFNTDRIHVRSMIKSGKNQIMLLDSRKGIIQVKYQGKMIQFKEHKLVYEQPGCYLLAGNKGADQLVLTCTLSVKNFFIQKLIRSYSFAQPHYQVTQTIFHNQKIYDISFSQNFIMSRIYSGVRLYWTSSNFITPYPYDYNNAGSIFLHNGLQSKLRIQNNQKIIYISTQDQIRRFQLKINVPYVWCYSMNKVQEQFKLTYSYPCENPTAMKKVCQGYQILKYSSWEHGQVKINTMLIPLGLSLIGAFVIVFVVYNVWKKNKNDIQAAKLKYNTENQFGM